VAVRALYAVAAFIALVSLWTPLQQPAIAERWFVWPALLYLSPVPAVTALLVFGLWRALHRVDTEWGAFRCAIGLFLLSFLGLGISLWPYAAPRAITIWQAAAQRETLIFLLVGVVILIPIILGYTAYAYWVFRGKVRAGEGYHG
jgi:cytochrome d ubiquinol oxidase subunit II